jgi:hypothetical protein
MGTSQERQETRVTFRKHSIRLETSNSGIRQLVQEELTFKIFNSRSCETLRQYKAETADRGGKDSCDVSLRKQLQVQSMSDSKKKRKKGADIEIDDDD